MYNRPEHKVMALAIAAGIIILLGYGAHSALAWLAKAAGWV